MAINLTPEQIAALDSTGEFPLTLCNPVTGRQYVLIPLEAYKEAKLFFDAMIERTEARLKELPPKPDWSDQKNNRRHDLIEKKFDSGLTADEEAELTILQDELTAWRQHVAPLPLTILQVIEMGFNRKEPSTSL